MEVPGWWSGQLEPISALAALTGKCCVLGANSAAPFREKDFSEGNRAA